MATQHCNLNLSPAQKPTQVIEQPNNHFPLADGIYTFAHNEHVIILDGIEVAWADTYSEASRSYKEMLAAELCEVA